jgi:hypothetical protein
MSKYLIAFILLVLLFIIETSFLQLLPSPINYFPLVLICSVFMIQYRSSTIGLWWLFGYGLFLDILGIGAVPGESIIWLLVGYTTWILSQRLLTNRSLYGILGSGFLAFTLGTVVHLVLTLSLPGSYILWQILWLVLALYLLFQFASRVSKYAF